MNPRHIITTVLLAATALACARAGVSTESPFVPRGLSALTTNNTPIELRGIVSDADGTKFAIYDPVKKEGAWVRVDDNSQAYTVRSYDAATNNIIVDYQGRTQTLTLVDPKFGPGKSVGAPITLPGVAPAQGQAAAQVQGRFASAQGQAAGATARAVQPNTAEASRLEAIRAEVARRRAAREAGSTN